MGVILTAKSDRYLLEVDDTTGAVEWSVDTRLQGVTPSWGETTEGRGAGVVPSNLEITVQDTPGRSLREVLSDGFANNRFLVRIWGPNGPNGTQFRWRGFLKPETMTSPASFMEHPDRLSLRCYDGLTRLKQQQDLAIMKRENVRDALWRAFSRAQDLNVVYATRCDHSAGLKKVYLDGDLDLVAFSDYKQDYGSWFEVLSELSQRYVARSYLDPFSHDASGRPQWKFVFRGIVGLEETNAYRYDGVSQEQVTIPEETVHIGRQSGLLETKDGNAFRGAAVRSVDETIESVGSDEEQSVRINNDEFIRDPGFLYTDSGVPLYGTSNGATVNSSDELEVDSGFYESTGQYKGDGTVWVELTYSTATDTASSLTVILKYTEEDGTVTSTSASPANATDDTLDLEVKPRADVAIRFETTGGVARLFNVSLKAYRFDRFRRPDLISQIAHTRTPAGILRQSTPPLAEFSMEGVSFTGPTLNAPCNFIHSVELDQTYHRRIEYASRLRLQLQPEGAQALRTRLRRIIGPSTRLIMDDRGEHYVMGGGRAVDFDNGSTELSDIQMLAYDRQDTRVNE